MSDVTINQIQPLPELPSTFNSLAILTDTHIRLDTPSYRERNFSYPLFTEQGNKNWDEFVKLVAEKAELTGEDGGYMYSSSNEKIHFHPDSISGRMSEETRNGIIGAVNATKGSVSKVHYVDLYESFYLVTIEETESRLSHYSDKIDQEILVLFKTTRKNKFKHAQNVYNALNKLEGLKVLVNGSISESNQVFRLFLQGALGRLKSKGLLIQAEGQDDEFYRAANKAEQKSLNKRTKQQQESPALGQGALAF